LYYEEERAKAKEEQVRAAYTTNAKTGKSTVIPEMEEASSGETTNEILAKKSGVGKSNIAYLLAVKRSRPDLFAKVFSGEWAIGLR